MTRKLSRLISSRDLKTHAFAAGMTLAMAAPLLEQGCPLAGQCATCGACGARASLLALPLVVDAAIVFGSRIWRKIGDRVEQIDTAEAASVIDLQADVIQDSIDSD